MCRPSFVPKFDAFALAGNQTRTLDIPPPTLPTSRHESGTISRLSVLSRRPRAGRVRGEIVINGGNWLSRKHLKGDLFGGVTTAIVSLPMALAFGIASGAGPEAGLYGAVLVGFWAALFGGTNTLISEPTGPMTLMMTTVMTRLAATHPDHALTIGFTVIMLAGVFQICFGVLKLGRHISRMPYSVISGFMSGIGLLLIIFQLAPLLGHPLPPGGAPGVLKALPDMLAALKVPELVLGGASIILLIAFPLEWRRRIPPQLVLLVVGTLLAWIIHRDVPLRTIGAVAATWPEIVLPLFTFELLGQILVDALLLAMLGCVDTLLTATIADTLTRSEHRPNRELIGQGIGNMISGLFGGLPGAGATMGTVVNIQSGAMTPRAGIVRSLTLLLIIVVAGPLLTNVPTVVLAAITMKVGVDILDWSFIRRAHKVSKVATALMYGVMILTVLVDVMVAVGLGVFIANMITIERLSRLQSENVKTVDPADDNVPMSDEERALFEQGRGHIVMFHLSGPMIFGVANAISRKHSEMQSARVLILDLSDVSFLSTTVGLAIENVIRDAEAAGHDVIIVGAAAKVRQRLTGLGLIGPEAKAHAEDTRLAALQRALSMLQPEHLN
jgi:sulfate permease, SulP family